MSVRNNIYPIRKVHKEGAPSNKERSIISKKAPAATNNSVITVDAKGVAEINGQTFWRDESNMRQFIGSGEDVPKDHQELKLLMNECACS